MGKTTLTNNVDFNVQVREGNSNIFRNLRVLKPGNSMTIQTDSNATYREYVLILLPNNEKLRPLSSDEIQELPAIEIFQDRKTGKIDWKELRKGVEIKSWFDSFLGLFSAKSGAKGNAKGDANVEGKADANVEGKADAIVEANAESSKSTIAT